MAGELFERIKRIRAFVFGVDGVMTDGNLLLLDNGEELRQMNTKDGFAIKYASDNRYRVGAITTSGSDAIIKRLTGLGVRNIFTGVESKQAAYEKFIIEHELRIDETLYMGDDIPDLPAMKAAGLAACPADAAPEVRQTAHYVAQAAGGRGCVREIIELVLRTQGHWDITK
jgi:3-deoxy-D-manno-octulosonate 8-phosphate phosphatase (KDO 8-P phosphatase)